MISERIRSIARSFVFTGFLVLVTSGGALSEVPKYQSQEISEKDGIPVLIKHLPDWESVRGRTTFAANSSEIKGALGDRPILDLIEFTAGTEAVTAPYDAGKLLIIEYSSPQASVEADARFTEKLAETDAGTTAYRRIGNYNVFVFDAADQMAAFVLLDRVKYEKQIHWLGDNPFRITAERAFVLTTSDIFLSTVLVIVIGIGFAIVVGSIAGLVYFQLRERRRAAMPTFTDAGGMTRLNLDGFTPEITPDRLLGD